MQPLKALSRINPFIAQSTGKALAPILSSCALIVATILIVFRKSRYTFLFSPFLFPLLYSAVILFVWTLINPWILNYSTLAIAERTRYSDLLGLSVALLFEAWATVLLTLRAQAFFASNLEVSLRNFFRPSSQSTDNLAIFLASVMLYMLKSVIPALIKEPLVVSVATLSSLYIVKAFPNRNKYNFKHLTGFALPLASFILSALSLVDSKRSSVVPAILSMLFLSKILQSSPSLLYKQVSIRTLLKHSSNIVTILLLLIAFYLFSSILQDLRCDYSVCGRTVFDTLRASLDVSYGISSIISGVSKLFEINTLAVHALNCWHLFSEGEISQIFIGPFHKIIGIGLLPFTRAEEISSMNEIYTGHVSSYFRSIGGSWPVLSIVSYPALYLFNLGIVYFALSVYILGFIGNFITSRFNHLAYFVIAVYSSFIFARGADLTLALYILIASSAFLKILLLFIDKTSSAFTK